MAGDDDDDDDDQEGCDDRVRGRAWSFVCRKKFTGELVMDSTCNDDEGHHYDEKSCEVM